jgi:hypothetical protein
MVYWRSDDVAKDKGVGTQTVVDAFLAQIKTVMAKAVQAGRLTQEQADAMQKQAAQTLATGLTKVMGKDLGQGRNMPDRERV